MARISNGSGLLTLQPQPDASFQRTRGGLDTGRRRYKCDHTVTADLVPDIDSADEDYPQMFVHSVDITEGKNGEDEVEVSYLGLISGSKPAVVTSDTASEWFYLNGYTFFEASPSVTRVYVSMSQPDPWITGRPLAPPGYGSPSPTLSSPYYAPIIDPTIAYQGWILKGRGTRQAGPYWEVTDTHEYIRVRST